MIPGTWRSWFLSKDPSNQEASLEASMGDRVRSGLIKQKDPWVGQLQPDLLFFIGTINSCPSRYSLTFADSSWSPEAQGA